MKTNSYSHPALFLSLLFLLFSAHLRAQVGIGTTTPNPGAALEISSNNKGILIPRVDIPNLTSLSPITGGQEKGLLVYNTNSTTGPGFFYWNSNTATGAWVPIGGAGGPGNSWTTTGNAGTSPNINFLGTTNDVGLRIKTNNSDRFEFSNNGRLRAYDGGLAAQPTYSFNGTNGQNMGMYRAGSGNLGFATNGLQRMRIQNNGKIAVNATQAWQTPHDYDLFVVYGEPDNTAIRGYAGSGSLSNSIWGENEYGGRGVNGTSNQGGDGVFGSNNPLSYTPPGVGVRGVNYGNGNGVEGSISNTGTGFAVYANGKAGGTGGWNGASDIRLKKDIKSLNNSLSKIMNLRGVEYFFDNTNYPGINLDTQHKQIGFIAQEVETVFPEVVSESTLYASFDNADGSATTARTGYDVKMVNYTGLIPVLVEAIKEQEAVIKSQEERLRILEQLVMEMNRRN